MYTHDILQHKSISKKQEHLYVNKAGASQLTLLRWSLSSPSLAVHALPTVWPQMFVHITAYHSMMSPCSSPSSSYSTSTHLYSIPSTSFSSLSRQLPLFLHLARCLHFQTMYWCWSNSIYTCLAAFTIMDSNKPNCLIWDVWNILRR